MNARTVMRALKSLARTGLHKTGAIHLARRLNHGIRILTYHRFTSQDAELLEKQCRYLRRHYQPTSLRDIAYCLRDGKRIPPNAVAVTVDDGYRDFLDHAVPVLRACGIPATVFLVADFIDRKQWLWWDPLLYSLQRTSRRILESSLGRFPIASEAERAAAFDGCVERLKTLPDRTRAAVLEDVLKQLDVALPSEIPPEMAPMTWDEIRSLRECAVEFGGHTRTHPILSRVETREAMCAEVSYCKLRIEQELGEPVLNFAYPNGRVTDWNDGVVEAVQAAGYLTAVTTVHGISRPGDSPFRLKRIAVNPDLPFDYFAELLAGVHPDDVCDA